MATVIELTRVGGPDVLSVREVELGEPGPGQVRIEQQAVGINYLDITQRNGAVPVPLPAVLGLEGAGIVGAVGAGVAGIQVGDRVGYATGPLGGYASSRFYPADRVVRLPAEVTSEDAAAVLFKGITAQYLLTTTFAVGPGTIMVLYGVAGGLGAIMAAWASHLGATVIGVVSREQSLVKARALGCAEAFVFDPRTLPEQVAAFTQGRMADVVYDPIGRATFAASLDCLRPRGLLVSFGASSGAPAPVEVATLNAKGSLYLTRPSIAAHTATAEQYHARAEHVLSMLKAGVIQPRISQTYPLAQASQAHADLESGRTSGTLLLIP